MWNLEITTEILPQLFENKIVSQNESMCIIQSNCTNKDKIMEWLTEFQHLSRTQYIQDKVRATLKRKICSVRYVCQHSCKNKVAKEDNKRGFSTNTKCIASIKVEVKQVKKNTKYTDLLLNDGLLATIKINTQHTHPLNSAETLRYLKPLSSDMKETFINYYKTGMGTSEACRKHASTLKCSEEEYASGRSNPPYRVAQNWFNTWRMEEFGPRTGEVLFKKLEDIIPQYKENGRTVIYQEEPFVTVIITDVMRRAHTLSEAKDIVFIDSTSSCDYENYNITFILTPCAAGAIPLGIIITRGESEVDYTCGLKLFNESIGIDSFGKQGYPSVIMSDKCKALMNAFETVWPYSICLLCVFHVLQYVWKWINDNSNSIASTDKKILMISFVRILYSIYENEAEDAYEAAVALGQKYPAWVVYLGEQWIIKEKWCAAYRHRITKGNHTNNYAEVSIRIFKDLVLEHSKTFNLISLVDSVVDIMDKVYKNKLRTFAYSRNANARKLFASMTKKAAYLKKEDIQQTGEWTYLIPSERIVGMYYNVDMRCLTCECVRNLQGYTCKHLFAAMINFDFNSPFVGNLPPITAKDRYLMAYIALGDETPNIDFFTSLHTDSAETLIQNDMNVPNTVDRVIQEDMTSSVVLNCCTIQNSNNVDTKLSEQAFSSVLSILTDLYSKYGKESLKGLRKFEQRLQNIKTTGQWAIFLNTAGSEMSKRPTRGRISVQPLSVARRERIKRGGCRVSKIGRPPTKTKKGTTRTKIHKLSTKYYK